MRLPGILDQSLWPDEAATWQQVNGGLGDVFVRTARDNYPPLYNLLAWFSLQLFGGSELALRLPALVLGLANIPLLYGLGARVGGRATGLLAALLLCLSGFHIWYSGEARMYSLLAFTATAHGWAALRFVGGEKRGRDLLLVWLSAVALLYSHPYGLLTWGSIGLGALIALLKGADQRSLVRAALVEAFAALGFLPWFLLLLRRAGKIAENGFWIDAPTPAFVFEQATAVTSGLVVPILVALPLLFFFRDRLRFVAAGGSIPVLLAWTVVPSVLGIAVSLAAEPIFIARYVIGSLPPFLVLFALAVLSLVRSRRNLAVAAVACTLAGIGTVIFLGPPPRADWRGMFAEVRANLRPQDCIVLLQSFHEWVLPYYLPEASLCPQGLPLGSLGSRVPPEASVFLAAVSDDVAVRAAAAAEIETGRPLAARRSFVGGELFTFGPAPLFDPR